MEIVLGLLAVLVVSGLVAAFIAARPRRRDAELEPPLPSPLPPPAASGAPPVPKAKAKRPVIPSEEELARQAAEVVAEAEAVLAGAREAPVVEPEPGDAPEEPSRPRFRDRLGKPAACWPATSARSGPAPRSTRRPGRSWRRP